MATHYGTWNDAWAHLDKEVFKSQALDIVAMTECVEAAETVFDNRLSIRFTVPFTVAENPEAYDIAKKATSRIAAAAYYERQNQAESKDEQSWFPRRLRQEAEEFIKLLETKRAPEDTPVADDPYVYAPTDLKTTAVNDALFTRTRIAGGSGHW